MQTMKQIQEISPTFCVSPWMEMILKPNSLLAPCCILASVKDEKGRAYNLVEDRLEDFWNGYGMKEIRKKMLVGEKVHVCQPCYYNESIQNMSRRESFNQTWLDYGHYENGAKDILDRVEKSRTNGYRVEKPPLRLDIRPKNLCNLKCRMCNSASSSKIEQEQKEILEMEEDVDTSFIDFSYLKMDEKLFNWHKNKEIWNTIHKWSPKIKSLFFTGGEPTLIKEVWSFINYLKEKDLAKNISLEFNTNCTQNPDRLIETFNTFCSLEINFSVDGYREVNDYIRFPSKWTEIENNIMKMLNNREANVCFYFTPVIQVYNILDLPQLLQFINQLPYEYGDDILHSIMLTHPEFLNIDILPDNVKKIALLKFEQTQFLNRKRHTHFLKQIDSIKNVLKSEEKPGIEKHLRNFYKYTKLLDRYRGNSFERTFPELNALLNEDGRWKT